MGVVHELECTLDLQIFEADLEVFAEPMIDDVSVLFFHNPLHP